MIFLTGFIGYVGVLTEQGIILDGINIGNDPCRAKFLLCKRKINGLDNPLFDFR